MSLFQFLRKNKQDTPPAESAYRSRAEEESDAVRARGQRSSGKNAGSLDPVLPEKKRARRRLIGAIALVLAAVIGLPMVLDTEPKPLADDIAIQIPSMDKPVRSNNAGQASASAKASIEPGKVATAPSSPGKDNDNAETAAPAAENESAKQPTADAKQANSQEAKPPTKPQRQTEQVEDSERAKAILEGKLEQKADGTKTGTEKKSGQYLVQVAALASQEKVSELQSKLKNAGITSHTQKVATQTGERIRIRVGPFAAKDDADKMRARLIKIGLNGTLVPV